MTKLRTILADEMCYIPTSHAVRAGRFLGLHVNMRKNKIGAFFSVDALYWSALGNTISDAENSAEFLLQCT